MENNRLSPSSYTLSEDKTKYLKNAALPFLHCAAVDYPTPGEDEKRSHDKMCMLRVELEHFNIELYSIVKELLSQSEQVIICAEGSATGTLFGEARVLAVDDIISDYFEISHSDFLVIVPSVYEKYGFYSPEGMNARVSLEGCRLTMEPHGRDGLVFIGEENNSSIEYNTELLGGELLIEEGRVSVINQKERDFVSGEEYRISYFAFFDNVMGDAVGIHYEREFCSLSVELIDKSGKYCDITLDSEHIKIERKKA